MNCCRKIKKIIAREILDSRGNPTVECDVITDFGFGRASVPSGASTGAFEAYELRDGGDRYNGSGVIKAVKNINEIISKELIGFDVTFQNKIDKLMCEIDGTKNKSKLGANSILAVSLAVSKCAAKCSKVSYFKYIGGVNSLTLPRPMMNIINGGKHADNSISCQEFMIVPMFNTFSKNLESSVKVYSELKKLLKKRGFSTAVGDEGGFAPNLDNDEDALKLIVESIELAKFTPGIDFKIALDPATNEMYEEAKKLGKEGSYYFWKTDKIYTVEQMIDLWKNWTNKYPIISIEDGMAENDWDGWKKLTENLGNIQLVGDDLFVTNKERLARGIKENVGNSILIKLNQIGTLSETLETISLAKNNGYSCIISHRSGETEDSSIADISVATNAGQIKTGAPARTDRVCKYNQLLRIEEELNS